MSDFSVTSRVDENVKSFVDAISYDSSIVIRRSDEKSRAYHFVNIIFEIIMVK